MLYEMIVLPIDEVNRVGLSHCTNDRRYGEEGENLDREHRKEKSGKFSCLNLCSTCVHFYTSFYGVSKPHGSYQSHGLFGLLRIFPDFPYPTFFATRPTYY